MTLMPEEPEPVPAEETVPEIVPNRLSNLSRKKSSRPLPEPVLTATDQAAIDDIFKRGTALQSPQL